MTATKILENEVWIWDCLEEPAILEIVEMKMSETIAERQRGSTLWIEL